MGRCPRPTRPTRPTSPTRPPHRRVRPRAGLLVAARADAVARLAALTGGFDELVAASRDSNADDEHDPEGATIAFERSQLDSLVTRTRAQLAELDAALERGCERGATAGARSAGAPIAPARPGGPAGGPDLHRLRGRHRGTGRSAGRRPAPRHPGRDSTREPPR